MPSSTLIITGGTKGLGRNISLAFARRGHSVLALYHSDDLAAGVLMEECAREGLKVRAVRHDVTSDIESAPVWSAQEIREASSLVLIHNACAAFEPKPLHLLSWDDFESSMRVGLKGGWACTRALVRSMSAAKKGHFVTVLSSAVNGLPPKGFAAYAAAKSALRSFTQSMAVEFAPRGIKVFSVSPGFMETALTAHWNAQLKASIRTTGTTSDPFVAAASVVDLVESDATPGLGEDYAI